jgi:uncharacterized membrane protein YjfL (UPF0719 family)
VVVSHTLDGVVLAAAMLALVVAVRFIFQGVSALEGYNLSVETVTNDNPAVGIRYAFLLLALILCFSQVIAPERLNLGDDLARIAAYGAVIIVVLLASRYVTDFLILSGFDNTKEVIGEKNSAVATVEGATYIATAFIIAGTLPDAEHHVAASAYWLLIGQALLVALAFGYRFAMPGLLKALDDHNQAAALSLAGLLVGSGIALGAAVGGETTSFGDDIWAVTRFMAGWLAFMAVAQVLCDRVMLPGHRLHSEVIAQANVAAGLIEGATFIGLTLIYTYTIG